MLQLCITLPLLAHLQNNGNSNLNHLCTCNFIEFRAKGGRGAETVTGMDGGKKSVGSKLRWWTEEEEENYEEEDNYGGEGGREVARE